jgi:hypothetical protein
MQITKKKVVAAVAGVAVVASAAVAFAFWTTTGSGKAETTAGTVGTLTVDVAVDNGSYPGDDPTGVAITGTITDNTSSAVSVTSIAGDPDYAATNHVTVDDKHKDCDLSAFTVKMDPLDGSPVTLAANGGSIPFTGRLLMAETGKNQDACQGATLTVHLKAE